MAVERVPVCQGELTVSWLCGWHSAPLDRFPSHANFEAFFEAAVLTLIAVVLVNGTVPVGTTSVAEIPPYTPLEETLATLAVPQPSEHRRSGSHPARSGASAPYRGRRALRAAIGPREGTEAAFAPSGRRAAGAEPPPGHGRSPAGLRRIRRAPRPALRPGVTRRNTAGGRRCCGAAGSPGAEPGPRGWGCSAAPLHGAARAQRPVPEVREGERRLSPVKGCERLLARE